MRPSTASCGRATADKVGGQWPHLLHQLRPLLHFYLLQEDLHHHLLHFHLLLGTFIPTSFTTSFFIPITSIITATSSPPPQLGLFEKSFLKTSRFEARNGPGNWKRDKFETRNGREMGNDTEFETRNGRKWDTKRYKKHHFSTINEKNRVKTGKTGEKSLKNRKKQEKTENYKKYRNIIWTRFRKTETSFRRDFGKC